MTWLFKNVTLVDRSYPSTSDKVDVFISEGIIRKIGVNLLAPDAKVVAMEDLHVSIGWMDIGASHGDPGEEHRESLSSLRATAAAGGFTALAPWPDTHPRVDNKAAIHYLTQLNHQEAVEIFPIASLSEKGEGKEMAELMDLHKAGAIGFSDGLKPVDNAGLFYRALKYTIGFDGICIHFPMDFNLAVDGQIHEGRISALLGLPGIPDVAEDLMIQRDLSLLDYADGKLLLWGLSSKAGVDRLRKSDRLNQSLFASVPIFNLVYSENDLESFDVNFKMMPPLRTENDKMALKEAVLDGTIQVISSNHLPWESEHKKLEFPYASFGSISLQHVFQMLRTHFPELPLINIVDILACHSRRIFKVDIPVIQEGAKANLTFFLPNAKAVIQKDDNTSLSENSPLWNEIMTGKIVGVFNNGKLVLNHEYLYSDF
jgi:dihydroorotase